MKNITNREYSKTKIILIVLIINIMATLILNQPLSLGADSGSLTIKLTPDSSKPIALQAVISYDTNLFDSFSISGSNGFSAVANTSNNKILLDASSATDGNVVATITLKIKSNITSDTETKVELNDVKVVGGDNELDIEGISVSSPSFTINSNSSSSNTDNNTSTNITTNVIATNNTNNESANNTGTEVITNRNLTETANRQAAKTINTINDNTTSKTAIPQTGSKNKIILCAIIIVVVAICTYIKYKKFYD